jgi:60 kDa SS-A/Ro ribonucleoprotein
VARNVQKLFAPLLRSRLAPAQTRTGYPAWERPLEERYLQALLSNTLGNAFYASSQQLLAEAAALHDEALAKDAAFAARALVFARQRGFMRTQPLFGLARLAQADPALFGRVFDRVVLTPGDLADFAALVKALRGGEGGRAIKRAAGAWMLAHLDEYRALKYGAQKAEGAYSLKDLLQVYHPKAGTKAAPKRLPLFDWLMGRAVDLSLLPQVRAFEALKAAKTDADKAALITEGRLPHEVATAFAGKSKEVWSALLPQLPVFALVRHLAALERHGVLAGHRGHVERLLGSAQALAKSKMFPMRFAQAFDQVQTAWVKDALRGAVELSFAHLPELPGRTVVALDRSGSMAQFMATAALFGLCLARRSGARVLLFDDKLEELQVSARDSLLTQARQVRARGGTDHSLAVNRLIEERCRVDHLVYLTDEQQNTGSPLLDRLDEYRRKVNREVNVFVLDVGPYGKGLAPPQERNTWFVYGWSDQALQFVAQAAQGLSTQVAEVRALAL